MKRSEKALKSIRQLHKQDDCYLCLFAKSKNKYSKGRKIFSVLCRSKFVLVFFVLLMEMIV